MENKDINYDQAAGEGQVPGNVSSSLNETLQRLFSNRAVVVVLVLFVLVFFYNTFLSPSKPKKQVKAVKQSAPLVVAPKKTSVVKISNKSDMKLQPLAQRKEPVLDEKEVHTLIEGHTKNLNIKLTTLINQINRLHLAVVKMDKRFSTVDKALKEYRGQSRSLAVRINDLQRKITDTASSNVAGEKGIEYNVRAVISGRAWLREKGTYNLKTVEVGDKLPGYGQVTEIDPDAGIVKTSSGRQVSVSY